MKITIKEKRLINKRRKAKAIKASNIIDIREKLKQKSKIKFEDLSKEVQRDLIKQKDMEKQVKEELESLNTDSKLNKLKNPKLMDDYQDDTNPINVLYWEASEKTSNKKANFKKQLAKVIINKYRKEIIKILKEDLSIIKQLYDFAKKAPAPQYIERMLGSPKQDKQIMLKWFESFE